jgi:hypothetical protein
VDDDEVGSFWESEPAFPERWQDSARSAVERALSTGVASMALAVYSRWWQLENWLRLLLYLELRAKRGVRWSSGLPRRGAQVAERDLENAYMPSADTSNVLAYIDTADLMATLSRSSVWPLVEYALVKKSRWEGVADELRSIRNRNAHLRRPHRDDLSRLEQVLRNLERGARLALESFNRQDWLPPDPRDRLAVAWVEKQHQEAQRIVDHARGQYETNFSLKVSRRPWAPKGTTETPISRQPGVLLHATWFARGDAILSPKAFWDDDYLDLGNARDLIVLVVFPSSSEVSVTFSSADSSGAIADAIGYCFDAVLNARERRPDGTWRQRWYQEAADLDWRVHSTSALVQAYPSQPFSVFES